MIVVRIFSWCCFIGKPIQMWPDGMTCTGKLSHKRTPIKKDIRNEYFLQNLAFRLNAVIDYWEVK